MDINDLRTVITVLACAAFLGIVVWAYSRNRKPDFDAAARLPFSVADDSESAAELTQTGENR